MGTKFAEVTGDYFMTLQNDERLCGDMKQNPALTMRRLWMYLKNAIPLFSRPAMVQSWLAYTPPAADDYAFTNTGVSEAPVTVQTGKAGFELCSVGTIGTDACGRAVYSPLPVSYDSATGEVVIGAKLSDGQLVEMDFYTDGFFENDLPDQMRSILGLCMQYVWETRYASSYLGMAPKINDRSSRFASENEKVRADTQRMEFLRAQLAGEMAKFEQNLYANKIVPKAAFPKLP